MIIITSTQKATTAKEIKYKCVASDLLIEHIYHESTASQYSVGKWTLLYKIVDFILFFIFCNGSLQSVQGLF